MKPTPLSTLELRDEGQLQGFVDHLAANPTKRHRHHLNDESVHCGDIIERFNGESWVAGRYEWTGKLNDNPVLILNDSETITLSENDLLRWPHSETR